MMLTIRASVAEASNHRLAWKRYIQGPQDSSQRFQAKEGLTGTGGYGRSASILKSIVKNISSIDL